MPATAQETLRRIVLPAGAILVLALLADRVGAESLTFYLFLAGIPIAAIGALQAIARSVDAARDGRPAPLGGLQAWLAGLLAAVFFVGAVARSPVLLEHGGPGLVPAAVTLGLCVLALFALAAAAPAPRR